LTELGINAWAQLQKVSDLTLPDYVSQMPWGHTPTGVVHIGLGAFHRAHQALVFDELLKSGDDRWAVTGVAMTNAGLVQTLERQQGLYSVRMASDAATRWQVCGALRQALVANQQPARVIAAMAHQQTRWITLTVTEKGYAPALASLLVDGLSQRWVENRAGLTLASCDNLPSNGRVLQALCLQEAGKRSAVLADWIRRECRFPSSMVDRIVPAANAAVLMSANQTLGVADAAALGTEMFWEWVIEDDFVDAGDAQALRQAGVQVAADVAVFEEAKLRMLNGCHSAMACIGAVAGLPVISDCIAQPQVRQYVHDMMTFEISQHVQRVDWTAYRDALLARFANPSLQHSVHQIASDSSKKIPLRWLPCAQAQLALGLPIHRWAFAAAAWMRYCLGENEAGQGYAISDPLAQTMQAIARQNAGRAEQTARAMLEIPGMWGAQLPQSPVWQEAVTQALQRISQKGLLTALAQLNDAPLA
jgi:fructuronate reductase